MRQGFDGLTVLVQQKLKLLLKVLQHDGQGMGLRAMNCRIGFPASDHPFHWPRQNAFRPQGPMVEQNQPFEPHESVNFYREIPVLHRGR
jgi:hypothetical protein